MAEKPSTDVFISYARPDLDRVAPIVRELRAAGFSVWWDQMLEPGTSWEAQIDQQLEAAKAVVVVWSEHSVDRFGTVCNEARYAERMGKLCTLNLDPVLPPTFFAHLHSENFVEWNGARAHPRFQNVLARVTKLARTGDEKADPALLALGERLTRIENLTWGYSRRINGFLDWLERRVDGGHPPERGLWLRCFTPGLLNVTLLLAAVYPILSIAIQWAATGAEGRVGSFVAIEARPEFGVERAALCGLVLLLAIMALSRRRPGLLGAGLVVFSLALTVIVTIAFVGALDVAFVIAVIVVVTAAGPFAGALAFSLALAIAVAGAYASVDAEARVGVLAVAILLGGLVAAFSAYLQDRLGRISGAPGLALALFMALLAGGLAVVLRGAPALTWSGLTALPADRAGVIVFMALLPLLNAIFDFCSIGLTRYLLRKGARSVSWRTLDYALLDLLLGALLFLGLGCASIAAIHLLRTADGLPLLNLAEIFTDIAQRPEAYWWLYATYFSTLLPTILHVVIVGAAFADIFVGRVAEKTKRALLIAQPAELDSTLRSLVIRTWIAQTFGLALGVAFSAGLIYLIAFGGGSIVASTMFDLFIGFAQLIGAIPWEWTRPV